MTQDYLKTTFDETNAEQVRNLDELPLWSAPFGLLLLEMIPIRKNMRVLDIGSGTGFPLLEIAGRLNPESQLVGIDPWREAVDRIQEKIRLRAITNVEIRAIHAESLPFESASFDLIVSNNGLNNVQDLPLVLSECRRVCKKDGQLVFTVNLPDTMIEFYGIFDRVLQDAGLPDVIERMRRHIHSKRKPLVETERLLQQAGFKILQKRLSSFAYRFADAVAMFRYYTIREFFLPSWQEIIPEQHVSFVFSQLEHSLNALVRADGEIRLTVPFVCLACTPGR